MFDPLFDNGRFSTLGTSGGHGGRNHTRHEPLDILPGASGELVHLGLSVISLVLRGESGVSLIRHFGLDCLCTFDSWVGVDEQKEGSRMDCRCFNARVPSDGYVIVRWRHQ